MRETVLKEVSVRHFRALKDVDLRFASDITLICGKNGTAKSTILGIVAQIFSFSKDYTTGSDLKFSTIEGKKFESQFRDHFRLSPAFDTPGTMEVTVHLFDGYTDADATGELTITSRHTKAGRSPRAVVRNNSTAAAGENNARNFTHPVIYLSLKRLYPIADRNKYEQGTFAFLERVDVASEFTSLCREVLIKAVDVHTSTLGTIPSAVSHGKNYDHRSVSVGQDNVGQIVLALLSFKKLKEEYRENYKGGILLIDEIDAGLFPRAQEQLIRVFQRYCKQLGIQVILTSHSVTLIDRIHDLASYDDSKYRLLYLTDTYGSISVESNLGYDQMLADLNVRTSGGPTAQAPRVPVYFEDAEAQDLFNALVHGSALKKYLKVAKTVKLGSENYLTLVKAGVVEFAKQSVICLDADVNPRKVQGFATVVRLPGDLSPDRLMFEYLYNVPSNADVWRNLVGYTYPVFMAQAEDLFRDLKISGSGRIDLKKVLASVVAPKNREQFKRWYKSHDLQNCLKSGWKNNPWRYWVLDNQSLQTQFLDKLESVVRNVYRARYGRTLP